MDCSRFPQGGEFKFEELRGARVVVVTNVASECGATASNYADFKKIQKEIEAWLGMELSREAVFICGEYISHPRYAETQEERTRAQAQIRADHEDHDSS